MNEKEMLIALKNKVEAQSKTIQEQNELISQYEAQGSAADQKLAALVQIQQDKVRNLMNSIQVLKKENAQLKNMGKEHKRSQLIEQLNSEIKDQDLVIEVLRKLINNEQKCDTEIVKALNQGPPKVKALTREELKIEVKKLQSQILLMREQAKKVVDNESVASSASTQSNKSTNDFKQYELRIISLQEELSNLKSAKGALEEENQNLHSQLDEKSEQVKRLGEASNNLVILNKKYEFLQQQIKEYQLREAGQQFEDINKELAIEEQKIINKAQESKLETVEKQLRRDLDIKTIEKEQTARELEKSKDELSQLTKKYNSMNKKYNELMEELNKTKADLLKQVQMYQSLEKSSREQIKMLEKSITEKDNEIQSHRFEIGELGQEIKRLKEGILELEADLQRMGAQQQVTDKQYDIEINKKIQAMFKHQQSENPQQLKEMMVQQQKFYEEAMKLMQKKISRQQDQISDISSNISQLVQQEVNDNLDNIDSDISQFQKKEDPDVDSNINLDIPSDIDSSVSQILQQAPKPAKKQVETPKLINMDSSIGSGHSLHQQSLDKVSSNVSDMQSLSRMSSNLSKISFTSSMQRQVQQQKLDKNKKPK